MELDKQEINRLNIEREKNGLSLLQNCRNAASGSMKLLDSKEVAKRNLECFIYHLPNAKEYNMQIQPKSVSVNIATLPNGIYFIQAINENGNRRNLKISK